MPSKTPVAEPVNNSDFFYIAILGCVLVIVLFLLYKLYSKYTSLSEKIENIEYNNTNKIEEERITKNIPEEIIEEDKDVHEEDMSRIDEEIEEED